MARAESGKPRPGRRADAMKEQSPPVPDCAGPCQPGPSACTGMPDARIAYRLHIRGQVQGVGFRPYVYRLASSYRLGGYVCNTPQGVQIEVEGPASAVAAFRQALGRELPPAARIAAIEAEPIAAVGRQTFLIHPSTGVGSLVTRVPHDTALCQGCRQEITDPSDRRHRYPFTTCTHCGPRYSIVEQMPYDRGNTTMGRFSMCPACAREFHDPADRRFHAQTNACDACGPRLALWDKNGRILASGEEALSAAVTLLRRGRILAVKGLGGFQLLVRADDFGAVSELRRRKKRPSKPLAVMVPDRTWAEHLAYLSACERRTLESPENPIVLVQRRPGVEAYVCNTVAPRLDTLGLFLPTTPLHALLLHSLACPIVATSGNRSEEPLARDENEALIRLGQIADAFLVHDRPIVRRLDDSIVRVMAGQPVVLRLARGYAPLPLYSLEVEGTEGILACGGHQKAAVALTSASQAVLLQHIGDLDHPDTRLVYRETIRDALALFGGTVQRTVCDLHPDYYSTRWAKEQSCPVWTVQHHQAHALACLAEHGALERPALAFTWDGTGLGTDGHLWGGECLRVHGRHMQRIASLRPLPLPGGEAAIRRPPRIAWAALVSLGDHIADADNVRWQRRLGLDPSEAAVLTNMIRAGLQTVWTTSVGRLFDAVAALLVPVREVSYEGEAALWLEALAADDTDERYEMPLVAVDRDGQVEDGPLWQADWRPALRALLADLDRGEDVARLAARFHNTLVAWAVSIAQRCPVGLVVLSGGCFQNRRLTEKVVAALRALDREVLSHERVPPNDGGLAAGQLAYALVRHRKAT
ncbi:MAG: carbamoyltransferase HypF [Gemmataceae bacterium]